MEALEETSQEVITSQYESSSGNQLTGITKRKAFDFPIESLLRNVLMRLKVLMLEITSDGDIFY